MTVSWTTSNGTAAPASTTWRSPACSRSRPARPARRCPSSSTATRVYEPDETFNVTLSAPRTRRSAPRPPQSPSPTTTPSQSCRSRPPPVPSSRAATTTTYTVTRSGNSSGAVSAVVSFGGTATRGSDYTVGGLARGLRGTATIALADGQTSATFTVTVVNDSAYEGNETVTAGLTSYTECAVGNPATTSLTIVDDDPKPLPTVSIGSVSVAEGGKGQPPPRSCLSRCRRRRTHRSRRRLHRRGATRPVAVTTPAGHRSRSRSLQDRQRRW